MSRGAELPELLLNSVKVVGVQHNWKKRGQHHKTSDGWNQELVGPKPTLLVDSSQRKRRKAEKSCCLRSTCHYVCCSSTWTRQVLRLCGLGRESYCRKLSRFKVLFFSLSFSLSKGISTMGLEICRSRTVFMVKTHLNFFQRFLWLRNGGRVCVHPWCSVLS